MVDGLPGRVARDRLTAVGNSLVPQVAQVWLQGIAQFYAENDQVELPPKGGSESKKGVVGG